MSRDIEPGRRVPIWPLDRSGKPIEQDLMDAAERIWPRIRAYAEHHQQDPSITANLLEATLVALSRARKSNGRLMRPIRNLDSYIYLAFIRRLNRQLAREPHIEAVGSTQDLNTLENMQRRAAPPSIEQEILVKELMTYLDEKPRAMYVLRYTGHSWTEIASLLWTTANNAQVSFNLGLKRARNRVMKPKRARNSGKGGATHE
jgi:hypothetical protein